MMRPMKLAGNQLMFGKGSLEHLKTIKAHRAIIVTGGTSMRKHGILEKVENYLLESDIQVQVFEGVEPDPSFSTVMKGAEQMLRYEPDLIVALGGGSAMDAAKAMWIYYEHPELKSLESILPPNQFPELRKKAIMCCIPSTAGTASEVSRSIVISDDVTGLKHGIGNMEMMPDIAICDPLVTQTMPAHITAETGMDALCHALEALVSNRANVLSDVLAIEAAEQIIHTLPKVCADLNDLELREKMLNASMMAGLAFTNVSLGIVHSISHTIGGHFHVAHGLGNAIILPYIIEYNKQSQDASRQYKRLEDRCQGKTIEKIVRELNARLGIKDTFQAIGVDEDVFLGELETLAKEALADGCTKTNPVIPDLDTMKELMKKIYYGCK